jgi:hypothetical protein
LGHAHDRIWLLLRWRVGTHDRFRSIDCDGDLPRVGEVVTRHGYPRLGLRDLRRVADDRGDAMSAGYEFLENAAAGFAGSAIESDFHDCLLEVVGLIERWEETRPP